MFFILMTLRVVLIPNYFVKHQTIDTVCTHSSPNKDPKIAVLPQKSRTQLHIATYWIFTIQTLLCKQMFVCYDLITVWLFTYCHETVCTFSCILSCILYYVGYSFYCTCTCVCVRLTRFNKCSLLACNLTRIKNIDKERLPCFIGHTR